MVAYLSTAACLFIDLLPLAHPLGVIGFLRAKGQALGITGAAGHLVRSWQWCTYAVTVLGIPAAHAHRCLA